MKTKFNIGDVIKNTQGYGTVKVIDIFQSLTNLDLIVYNIQTIQSGAVFLANEDELESVED